ncbi:hypothetical protein GQ43DRAFT_444702 [Delitschia confertaspora ATCC 74209]|uniref:Uncharacterized protein n=1 Tax=Delitschia confertaspora ATCC 74209 TaxID=1513339 RepID=A0A9P4MNA8_9PLEO|nr:hypothetical protein GQ43DRAFT_444702 [Delitschia confertaspora ATCC 74209]
MGFSSYLPRQLLLTILLFLNPFTAVFVAAHYSVSTNEGPSGDPSDLASMLQSAPPGQQELLSNALRIIHSMESSPTCNRLAALSLINSCKSLEQVPEDSKDSKMKPDDILDHVKSEYAARLAVCELMGATINPPKECAILIPSSSACVKHKFRSLFAWNEVTPTAELCYPETTRTQFERCLRTLDSRPQWWISYSNARQNAVVMCHASRDAIEREKNLSVYKSLVEATVSISSALEDSIKGAQARLAEQMEFIENLRSSQEQAMRDVRKHRQETSSTLSQVVTEVQQSFQSFMDMVTHAWGVAESQAEILNKSLHASRMTADKTREELQNLFKAMAIANSQHKEISELQNRQLSSNHETAVAVQQALDVVHSGQVHALSEAMGMLQAGVQSSFNLMGEMYDRQTDLDQRLVNLNGAFDTLETTATHLQSTIEETTGTIQIIASFVRAGTRPAVLGLILLLLLALWLADKRIAGILIISVIFYSLYSSRIPDHDISGFISRLHIPQPNIIIVTIVGVAACSTLLAVVGLWIVRSYIFYFEDGWGQKGMLPALESPARCYY